MNNVKDFDIRLEYYTKRRNHLIKHGVKSKHISSDKVNTLTIKNLIEKYNKEHPETPFIREGETNQKNTEVNMSYSGK